MYKSRFLIWLGLAITLILGKIAYNQIQNYDASHPTYTIYADSRDLAINSKVTDLNDGKAKFQLVKNNANPDIILMEHSNEVIEGYKKYENYLYTPMAMYALHPTDNGSGFNVDGYVAYKDFKIILEAFENELTYEDIGISKNLNGTVQLAIPNKSSHFYEAVKELFYVTLNDGKKPTDIERETLSTRVDKLLAKCVEVEDVKQKLINLYNTGEKKNPKDTIYIGPESIVATGSDGIKQSTNSDSSKWQIVYFNYTTIAGYDVFVKESETTEKTLSYFNNSGISGGTGYRLYGHEDKISGTYIMDNVRVID